jgi:hypothetical protein
MDSFELVRSNISVSKKSIEDSSVELIMNVLVLCCSPEVLGSSHDHARIMFFLSLCGEFVITALFSNFFLQTNFHKSINCYATKKEATIY